MTLILGYNAFVTAGIVQLRTATWYPCSLLCIKGVMKDSEDSIKFLKNQN